MGQFERYGTLYLIFACLPHVISLQLDCADNCLLFSLGERMERAVFVVHCCTEPPRWLTITTGNARRRNKNSGVVSCGCIRKFL